MTDRVNNPVEIVIIGSWPNPYKSQADKVVAIRNKMWNPDEQDFTKLADQSGIDKTNIMGLKASSNPSDTIRQFLACIVFNADGKEHADNSVKRVDFITHGKAGVLCLGGTLSVAPSRSSLVYFDTIVDENTLLDLEEDKFAFNKLKKHFGLEDVLRKFTQDAIFYIFACDSASLAGTKEGSAAIFLQEVADILGIRVTGFDKALCFRYLQNKFGTIGIVKERESGICDAIPDSVFVRDIHMLDGAAVRPIEPRKKKKT